MQNGDYVRCRDDDLNEEYIGQIVCLTSVARNQLVRIVSVIEYTMQHAIAWHDVANEKPPYRYGDLAWLRIIGPAAGCEDTQAGYDKAFEKALSEALKKAETDAEREILLRHRQGIFKQKRLTYKKY